MREYQYWVEMDIQNPDWFFIWNRMDVRCGIPVKHLIPLRYKHMCYFDKKYGIKL